MQNIWRRLVRLFALWLIIMTAFSCMSTHHISLERGKLFIPPGTNIYSVVLKSGDTVRFDGYYGEFRESDSQGNRREMIVGYNADNALVEVPVEKVAIIHGENSRTEAWQANLIGYIGIFFLTPSILLFAYLIDLLNR